MIWKVCSKCGEEKEEGEFCKGKNNKDGLVSWCRTCRRKYQREWRRNNIEKRRGYNKKYYENNIERVKASSKEWHKEWHKEWYKNNAEKKREYNKEWHRNNKDKRIKYSKEYRNSSALYNTYVHQISYAEPTRHDPKNEELLQVKCTYCGRWFNPAISSLKNRISALEGKGKGEQRLYCSKECKQLCPTYRKRKYSAEQTNTKNLSREVQAELRQMVFERDEWICIKCGETKALQCHHIEGIQWNPIESADIDLCVTFCVKCHGEAHRDEGCRYVDLQCRREV